MYICKWKGRNITTTTEKYFTVGSNLKLLSASESMAIVPIVKVYSHYFLFLCLPSKFWYLSLNWYLCAECILLSASLILTLFLLPWKLNNRKWYVFVIYISYKLKQWRKYKSLPLLCIDRQSETQHWDIGIANIACLNNY